eukprot:scaffold880_cov384-Prasinococcus_capsulatus_cf.AAC.12
MTAFLALTSPTRVPIRPASRAASRCRCTSHTKLRRAESTLGNSCGQLHTQRDPHTHLTHGNSIVQISGKTQRHRPCAGSSSPARTLSSPFPALGAVKRSRSWLQRRSTVCA